MISSSNKRFSLTWIKLASKFQLNNLKNKSFILLLSQNTKAKEWKESIKSGGKQQSWDCMDLVLLDYFY